jgi:hypothetical protein
MLVLAFVVAGCDASSLATPPTAGSSQPSSAVIPSAPPTGGPLELDVTDPNGDNTGPIDVRSMTFVFDNTGAFNITLQADASAPFATGGSIRININLYNPAKSSYFHCNPVDFSLSADTRTVVLTGSSSELTSWASGDLVYTNSLAGTPNPPNVSEYRSQVVWNFDINATTQLEDVIAFKDLSKPVKVVRSKATLGSQGLACFTG